MSLQARTGKLKEQRCFEVLKRDQAKLGMTPGDLHGCRRFFATTMLAHRADHEAARQWCGWNTLETMLRYLPVASEDRSVKAMQEVAARIAAS